MDIETMVQQSELRTAALIKGLEKELESIRKLLNTKASITLSAKQERAHKKLKREVSLLLTSVKGLERKLHKRKNPYKTRGKHKRTQGQDKEKDTS